MVRGKMVYFAVMKSLIQRSTASSRRAIQTDLHLIDPYRDLRQTLHRQFSFPTLSGAVPLS
jgi:hypothetical protein